MRPSVGGMNPVIIRMDVDLPAPLGPRKPSTSPRSTVNEIPFTARLVPNILTNLSTLIMAAKCRFRKRREQITSCRHGVKRQSQLPRSLRPRDDLDNGREKMFKLF